MSARKVSPLRLIIKFRKLRARPLVETTQQKRTWTYRRTSQTALAGAGRWAFLAVIGEGIADLAEPWPLKIVLDNVLRLQARSCCSMAG